MRTDLTLTPRPLLASIVSRCTAIDVVVKAALFPDELRVLGVGSPAARADSD